MGSGRGVVGRKIGEVTGAVRAGEGLDLGAEDGGRTMHLTEVCEGELGR